MTAREKIKVLVVDDSLVTRRLFSHLIESSDEFEFAGEAKDGLQAIEMVKQLSPDVVSMDIEMPGLDGIEATKRIMEVCPVPVVIVSSLYQPGETQLAMEVLAAGAVEIIPKPVGPGSPDYQKRALHYLRTLRAMSEVKVVRRKATIASTLNAQFPAQASMPPAGRKFGLVVVGASAGGPEGVRTIVASLPADINFPMAIVQHIDINFAQGYAHWLASHSKVPVVMVTGDLPLKPGRIYLSIRPQHLVIKNHNTIGLIDHPADNGLKPSVASLFRSAGEVFQDQLIAVLLSGMGRDGAAEMLRLKQIGAFNIIQDEQSCLVFGMPGEAAKLGANHVALSPEKISSHILKLTNKI